MSDDNNNNEEIDQKQSGKADHLVKYQFGKDGGNDPREAKQKQTEAGQGNQHSIRNSLRRLMTQDIDVTKTPTAKDMAKMFGRSGTKIKMHEMMAIASVQQALKNFKAMENVINNVDGKLVEKQMTTNVTLADLVTKSYEAEEGQEGIE